MRIFAQGAFVLLSIIALWWRQGVYIGLVRYIQAVYVLLFLMAGCLIAVMVGQSIRYGAARHQSRSFAREVAEALHDHNLDHAMAIAERYATSPTAKVMASGLASFQAAVRFLNDAEAIETTHLALRRSAGVVHGELKGGLSLLASISSTAPLVGAFGTVLGIVDSFQGFDGARWTIIAYVCESVAHAVLLTALSLVLGILTTWCYKHLTGELEAFDTEMKNESSRLVNYLVIHLEQRKQLPSG
jgi:biopolymer transport protein ExbB/TolQ